MRSLLPLKPLDGGNVPRVTGIQMRPRRPMQGRTLMGMAPTTGNKADLRAPFIGGRKLLP